MFESFFSGSATSCVCGDFQRRRQHSVTTMHRALPVCELPAMGMPRGIARSNAAPAVCGRTGGPALGTAAGLGRWLVGVAVLPVCGDFQRRRQHSATTVHRALPVCDWSAMGILLGTARSHAASAVCIRSGGIALGAAAGPGR
mgnify:CR=1 FL=1